MQFSPFVTSGLKPLFSNSVLFSDVYVRNPVLSVPQSYVMASDTVNDILHPDKET